MTWATLWVPLWIVRLETKLGDDEPASKVPSGSGDKQKPARNSAGNESKWLCGDPDCDALMNTRSRMKAVAPGRCHYFILPKEPKELTSNKKRAQGDIEKRERRSHTRKRQVQTLPQAAKLYASDAKYADSTKLVWASAHLPPEVYPASILAPHFFH